MDISHTTDGITWVRKCFAGRKMLHDEALLKYLFIEKTGFIAPQRFSNLYSPIFFLRKCCHKPILSEEMKKSILVEFFHSSPPAFC